MSMRASLPYFSEGIIVKGFGRGSKALGIPTANFPKDVVDALPPDFDTGIYCGWASVRGNVHKMVMSIGWNPFYKNIEKSMEVHVLHKFDNDLYGEKMKVVVLDYIRQEKDFTSIDALIAEIKNDICVTEQRLEEPKFRDYKSHSFFLDAN